ncbi:hypothetical protein LC613_28270 [Nostoc sphaeroides CHAB 2801]|nr:hypothetical protein [Nostoc sphaeroides]MCC5631628.1 hypothetical protein [Nostoc sphaeroides CHAB 2801]
MAFQVEITPIAEAQIELTIRGTTVNVLYVRHSGQAPLTVDDLEELEGGV